MSINPFIKIIAGLLGGSLALGAPVIPQDTGYYIRTKPSTEVQFEKVPTLHNISGLTKANIIGEACYNEFTFTDGKKEREKLDCVEYEKFGTVPNYPVPSKNGAEWMAYKTHKFDTPSGDLEEGYYSVEGIEKVSLGNMLLGSKRVEAAITFINASSSSQQTSVSSITWTYNNTASTDDAMVYGLYLDENTDASRDVTAASFNSVAMTGEQENDNTTDNYRTEIWRLINPDSGANTVSVTFNGVLDRTATVMTTYEGVHQTAPIGDKDGFTATNVQNATTTLTTTAADSLLMDTAVCSRTDSGANIVGAGQTERFNQTLSQAQLSVSTEPGGGSGSSLDMSWRCPTAAADWAQSAVEIMAAAGAAPAETANVHIKDADLIIKDGNLIIKD